MTVTTCTPLPESALRYDGSVATRVLPSPVFISAMLPRCSAAPPMTWTSKGRMPMHPLGGLADGGERLGHQVVERLAVLEALP